MVTVLTKYCLSEILAILSVLDVLCRKDTRGDLVKPAMWVPSFTQPYFGHTWSASPASHLLKEVLRLGS